MSAAPLLTCRTSRRVCGLKWQLQAASGDGVRRRTPRRVRGVKYRRPDDYPKERKGRTPRRGHGLKWVSGAVWGIPLFTDLGMKLGK